MNQLTLRPTRDEWRRFAAHALHAAGLGALGAGVIFFVAANWQAWGVMGRFALLQAGLLVCIALALWRVPPHPVGQGALLLAVLFTGGSLALFGQSYQTGADVYELFFAWAALTLPFALAGLSGAVWAAWWTVLNAGLALLCGGLGLDHLLWRVFDGRGVDRSLLPLLACAINLLGAAGAVALQRTRVKAAAPLWLARYLATLGMAYGTWAALPFNGSGGGMVALVALVSIAVGVATWRHQRDVFPLTLLAGSWIAISTSWLVHGLRLNDIGEFFMVAIWLIGSSTAAAMLLMHWLRRWRAAAEPGVTP